MHSRLIPVVVSLVVLATGRVIAADAISSNTAPRAIEEIRRLYDASPVSVTNPILARVPECGIEIPVAEYRAFVNFDLPMAETPRLLTEEEKRRELEKLLDEHFLVWDGYRRQADRTEEIAPLLEITRIEAMKAMVIEQDVGPKAQTFEDYRKLTAELRQKLFDKVDIRISEKAYETLVAGLKRLNAAGTNRVEDAAVSSGGLTDEERALPLATSKFGVLRVGEVLQACREVAPEQRPRMETKADFVQFLKESLQDEILLAEARERKLDQADLVRQQVQSDRTGLVRQWALGRINQLAAAEMKKAGHDQRLKDWYAANKTRYSIRDGQGKETVPEFEKHREVVESDYFDEVLNRVRTEELRGLRDGKKIEISEKLFAELLVGWPSRAPRPQLPDTAVSWDTDRHEYVVKAGETNATFVFTMTNRLTHEFEIDAVHPVNQFVSVQGPALPWKLKPGESRDVKLNVDLRNKVGVGYANIYVETGMGRKTLTLKIAYPQRMN